ncbi:conserved Plasmodium protein, unknown function [Plasmodium gallinaceum]|uniref:Uncharacterized protein n=1 Tax=Plasmodium gallinaceum TaxID=5849 RepID=A0A1J1GSZ2_PLAGA|nr:conserved Plasmodium protein, unknown function [Plasmodium gallinaceum]CRG94424.1 conserved Plasmodium protein, unknown function [Plasmodium gallinaceum]
MRILKLKSEKKKKEKSKETKIDYQKCIKKTKIKNKKIEKENEFDISIFMKTNHASNKIRQLNYAKLIKSIRKNKNIIHNHIEKIIEIYGIGIIDEDKNIRNYSSKIFYHLLNNVNYDVFFGKIKTSLFHSLKIEKPSLKVLNLELCHHFFFEKIRYCNNFFYEFLNNVLECFLSLSIENQTKSIKYIFLLFKYKVKYKRDILIDGKEEKSRYINENEIKSSFKKDKYVNKKIINEGDFTGSINMKEDTERNFMNNEENIDNSDDYQKIIHNNMLNSYNDNFLIKKDIKITVEKHTKIVIYTKLFKCLYNFMDEVIYNSINVDFVHLYKKIIKTIIFVIKKKIFLKTEMILLINKFIKRSIKLINENLLHLKNWKILNLIYYLIVLVVLLCLKEIKFVQIEKKKLHMNLLLLLKYCFTIYYYILVKFEFFTIKFKRKEIKEKNDIINENKKTHILNDINSDTEYGETKYNSNNYSDNNNNRNNNNNNNNENKNYIKYAKKYFNILIYFYQIYINKRNKRSFLNINISTGILNSQNSEIDEKDNSIQNIINLIENNKNIFFNNETKIINNIILKYLKNFSEKSIEEIIYFCYYIIILVQNRNDQDGNNEKFFIEKLLFTKKMNKTNKNNMNVLLLFQFLTIPFVFLFLIDSNNFINNNFFNNFYKSFNEEKKNIMDTIFFLQNEESINIITNRTFDNFINNILFFLYNYNEEFFVNNFLFFFCHLNNNNKVKKIYTNFRNEENRNELHSLLRSDIRNDLYKRINETKKNLIHFFLNQNNFNILSFEIIKNLYFLYEHNNSKLLLFIYYIIIKFSFFKSKNDLLEKEVMIILHKIFSAKKRDSYKIKDKIRNIKNTNNDYIEICKKKCMFIINNEYLYKDDFLFFFLKLNIQETYIIYENHVHSLINLKSLMNNSNDDNVYKWDKIKCNNIILIIKKISYIISNIKIFILKNNKSVNNNYILINYLLRIFKEVKLNDSSNDNIFILIKIILLFYFTSFYLSESLFLKIDNICEEKVEDDKCEISLKRKIDNKNIVNFIPSKKKMKKRKINVVSVNKNNEEKIDENNLKMNINIFSKEEKVEKRTIFYSDIFYNKIDILILISFLKKSFNNFVNIKKNSKINNLEYILPYFFSRKIFSLFLEREFFYLSLINKNLENIKCVNNSYDIRTHKYVQEMLDEFENNIKFVSFEKLINLPVRTIIKLFCISIFKMAANKNILYVTFSNNLQNLPREYFYHLNFFLYFYYFISFLIKKICNFAKDSFSFSNYYSISFLIDTILCSYCIKEEVEKVMVLFEREEIYVKTKKKLKKLNKKLNNVIDNISKYENKNFFPNTEFIKNYF